MHVEEYSSGIKSFHLPLVVTSMLFLYTDKKLTHKKETFSRLDILRFYLLEMKFVE
jgi:hypothetical protein